MCSPPATGYTYRFRAGSLNEPIRKESFVLLAIRLGGDSLLQKPILVKFQEGILNDLGLLVGSSPSEVIEADLEPVVDGLVLDMELVAKRLWSDTGFKSASLGGCAVLVSSADVESWPVAQFAVAAEDVGAECAADDVSEMGNVVHVRESGGNEDVVFPPRFGKNYWFGCCSSHW